MKTVKEFLAEKYKLKTDTYYNVGGDPYDGGVDLEVFVKGKSVFKQSLVGNDEFKVKGKTISDFDKVIDAIGKKFGLKYKDFERNKGYTE